MRQKNLLPYEVLNDTLLSFLLTYKIETNEKKQSAIKTSYRILVNQINDDRPILKTINSIELFNLLSFVKDNVLNKIEVINEYSNYKLLNKYFDIENDKDKFKDDKKIIFEFNKEGKCNTAYTDEFNLIKLYTVINSIHNDMKVNSIATTVNNNLIHMFKLLSGAQNQSPIIKPNGPAILKPLK